MIQFSKRLFKNLKISTEIFIATATLILFVSGTYAVVNYINLTKIDRQVNEQVGLLTQQQDTLIQYYSAVTAESQVARIQNVQKFASFVAKFAYFNTLFSSWNISEPGNPMVCKEVQFRLNDTVLDSIRDMSKSHSTLILSRTAIPGFFSSSDNVLSLAEQQQLTAHFGSNLNLFNFVMRDSFSSYIEERIGLLTLQLLTNAADDQDYRGIFHIFPGGCQDVDLYRPLISRPPSPEPILVDLKKVLAADSTKKDTDLERKSKLHLMEPFFDSVSQKWVSLACSFYALAKPFWRQVTSGTKTYNSSVIGCLLVDMTKLLDYKLAVNNTKVLVPPLANQTLLPIANSYQISADNSSRILAMPRILAANYNYTSLFSPELLRYTGFATESRHKQLIDLDHGRLGLLNFRENLAADPLDPTLVNSVQIHVRSVNVSHKHPVEPSYSMRSILYFNMEDLTASKSLIENNISNAQSQISFLALIVIIIICAVVICISFQ